MSGLTDIEKSGLQHFFQSVNDPNLLIQLANLITKNTSQVNDPNEAYNIILLHSSDITTLLSKKILKKEILFKYLHKNKYPVRNDFTKSALIVTILEFWKSREINNETTLLAIDKSNIDESSTNASLAANDIDKYDDDSNSRLSSNTINVESEFPINVMAREFSTWFFKKYNDYDITALDFWSDSQLNIQIIIQSDNIIHSECSGNENVLKTLIDLRKEYNFYFNPTMSHEGVQGRMNIHGLVLVLICGTLHDSNHCVGVFEAVFSLARDPYSDNNWKVKKIQMILRNASCSGNSITSGSSTSLPTRLTESEAMRSILNLPLTSDNI